MYPEPRAIMPSRNSAMSLRWMAPIFLSPTQAKGHGQVPLVLALTPWTLEHKRMMPHVKVSDLRKGQLSVGLLSGYLQFMDGIAPIGYLSDAAHRLRSGISNSYFGELAQGHAVAWSVLTAVAKQPSLRSTVRHTEPKASYQGVPNIDLDGIFLALLGWLQLPKQI